MRNNRIFIVLTIVVFAATPIIWTVFNDSLDEPKVSVQSSTSSSTQAKVQIHIDPDPGPSIGAPGAMSLETVTLNFVYLDEEGNGIMHVSDSAGEIQEIRVRDIRSFDAYPMVPGKMYDVYFDESGFVYDIVPLIASPEAS